jgi:hypothetical protein
MKEFNNREISQWESESLHIIENLYGKSSSIYREFISLTKQGYWRPSKGDPRGSAACSRLYQKEYMEHISKYKNLLGLMKIDY